MIFDSVVAVDGPMGLEACIADPHGEGPVRPWIYTDF